MSSLRERQKKARGEQILAAARKLFLDHGYSKTNMEEIADEAEVGVSSIYTYFESKEGVVKALIEKDFGEVIIEADALIANAPAEPVKAVVALLTIYRGFDEYMSYEMMHDFVSQARTKGPVKDAVDWLHDVQVDQIKQILETAQKAGTISQTLDAKVAAGITVDLLAKHVSRLTDERRTSKDSKAFYARVSILFDNWCA